LVPIPVVCSVKLSPVPTILYQTPGEKVPLHPGTASGVASVVLPATLVPHVARTELAQRSLAGGTAKASTLRLHRVRKLIATHVANEGRLDPELDDRERMALGMLEK
jgi:hypothetical protein